MSKLNMPLAVLDTEPTAEQIVELQALGFTEWVDSAGDPAESFLLTDNGSGAGEKSYSTSVPTLLIQLQAALGNGTIYNTIDELITAYKESIA